jgi:hypothetical protein
MVDIRTDEFRLLLESGIVVCVAGPRLGGIVVVVAPFREVVCKF